MWNETKNFIYLKFQTIKHPHKLKLKKSIGNLNMSNIEELGCFLNSIKETLPFDDEKDFRKKIAESKEFRIRVQKLVYLSKFFGWDNNYHFNFHPRGPYSVELSEDYNHFTSQVSFKKEINLRINQFKEFTVNKSNDFLETASTILYYLKMINAQTINEEKIIEILRYIKPHIPQKTVEEAFKKITILNLLNSNATSNLEYDKKIIIDKIEGLQRIFMNFESCSNQTLILGSLDYFKLALKKENLKSDETSNLLNAIYDYCEKIEIFYFTNYKLIDEFAYYDLSSIDERFNQLQNYISNLNIIPRLYDENVDLNIFYE